MRFITFARPLGFLLTFLPLPGLLPSVLASPSPGPTDAPNPPPSLAKLAYIRALALERRSPYFPEDPPSCQLCAKDYSSIDSCSSAVSVFDNYRQILFNPGAFIDIIRCSCTDTFQSVFPQCADCFIQTNQTEYLTCPADQLPAVLTGIREICALASVLLGGVASANSQLEGQTPITVPKPTAAAALRTIALPGLDGLLLSMGSVVLGLLLGLAGTIVVG